MTAKIFDNEDLKYGRSVLAKVGLVPPDDHLGILYEAWKLAGERYDPLKSNWLTFFGYTLRSVVQEERRYGKLIHIPVTEQSDTQHQYIPLDYSVDDSPLHDIIPDTSEEGTDSHLLAFFIDELGSMYTKAPSVLKEAIIDFQDHLVNGTNLTRKYRTQHMQIRAELYDRYKKWKEIT